MSGFLPVSQKDTISQQYTDTLADDSSPVWEAVTQPLAGAFYGVGVAGSKMSTLAAHTLSYLPINALYMAAVNKITGEDQRENMLQHVNDIEDYWGRDAGARTTAGQLMFSVGKGLSQFAYGWGSAAALAGTERAQQSIAEGKTLGQAYTLGGVDAATSALAGATPFRAPLLGPAAWRTGAAATLQRVGYGVASNVIPGMAQRGVTGYLLDSWGYQDEAKNYRALDPTALAVDTIMGSALGGAARYMDVRSARMLEASVKERNAAMRRDLTQQTESIRPPNEPIRVEQEMIARLDKYLTEEKARPADQKVATPALVDEISTQARATTDLKTFDDALSKLEPATKNDRDLITSIRRDLADTRYKAELQRAQEKVLGFLAGKDPEHESLRMYLDEAYDLDSQLRAIGDHGTADNLKYLHDQTLPAPEQVDAAMVANRDLSLMDQAIPGRSQSELSRGSVVSQHDRMMKQMDIGGEMDLPKLDTVPDPERLAYLERKAEVMRENGALPEVAEPERVPVDYSRTSQAPTLDKQAAEIESFIESNKEGRFIVESETIDPATGLPKMEEVGYEEYKKLHDESMKQADEEGSALRDLVSCMLR